MEANQLQGSSVPLPFEQPQKVDKIAEALAKAQEEIGTVAKNSKGVYGMFANHGDCWEAVRKILSKNGLCLVQLTAPDPRGIMLTTKLVHKTGQFFEMEMFMPARDPSNPQTYGSALTYARRYSLCSITGLVADEDDDGEHAVPKGKPATNTTSKGPKATNWDPKSPDAPWRSKPATAKAIGLAGKLLREKFGDEGAITDFLFKTFGQELVGTENGGATLARLTGGNVSDMIEELKK